MQRQLQKMILKAVVISVLILASSVSTAKNAKQVSTKCRISEHRAGINAPWQMQRVSSCYFLTDQMETLN